MTVVESSDINSGMTQGRIVRRHQIPFNTSPAEPDPGPRITGSKYLTMWDLNVGVDVNIYGKIFKIVNCDIFTRNFLTTQGVSVPVEIPIPKRFDKNQFSVEYHHYLLCREYQERRLASGKTEPKKPYKKLNNLSQFLENDGKVIINIDY